VGAGVVGISMLCLHSAYVLFSLFSFLIFSVVYIVINFKKRNRNQDQDHELGMYGLGVW